MPFFTDPRTRRLERDLREMIELRDQSTILDFTAHGDPPDRYELVFRGRGLGSKGKDFQDIHEVELRLGADYPRTAPSIAWKTSIGHPNISGPNVCLGTFRMSPFVRLTELVEILWDMARMASFNPYSAYNARNWHEVAREVGGFPVDPRILRDRIMPGAPPTPEEPGEPEIFIMGAAERLRDGGSGDRAQKVARTTYGAGLLLLRPSDRRVLLVRRSPELPFPGRWAPPGGGEEPGETPVETALREAREELGTLPPIDLLSDEGHWRARGPYYAFATFLGMLLEGQEGWEPALNWENTEWGWFGLRDLPAPLMPGVAAAVRDLVGRSVLRTPPHMGISPPPKTYTICKGVHMDETSPFFLSLSVTVIDEAFRDSLSLSVPFMDRVPQLLFFPLCRRADPGRVADHYQGLLDDDPDLVISCVKGLPPEEVVDATLSEVREKGDPVGGAALEARFREFLRDCLMIE